jgi:4-hydroxy-3-methylbut-2-en-1-yl diphosphate synthase IspG/GcpE
MGRRALSIESRCEHSTPYLRGIVMLCIAGKIASETVVPCPTCGKVAFYVREIVEDVDERRTSHGA